MSEVKTKLHGQEAINAFNKAYQGGLCYVWAYSPNGGYGNANGEDAWQTQEEVNELLNTDWEEATWDGEQLVLGTYPERGVHQEYTLNPSLENEWAGEKIAACHGAHYGFVWGSSCDEIDSYELAEDLQTELLEVLIPYYNGEEEKLGLEGLEDPTDDGTNWAVKDEELFLKAARLAKFIEDSNPECDSSELRDEFVEQWDECEK